MNDALTQFLTSTGWASAKMVPVAGDMSVRRYYRLATSDRSAILMDARSDIPSTRAFVLMSNWLREAGLSAPAILQNGVDHGLLVLEDFGDIAVSGVLADGGREDDIFPLCLDLLMVIRKTAPPGNLSRPDAGDLSAWTALADEYYPGADPGALMAFRDGLETILNDVLTENATVSLRDFHADNLIWLDGREGVAKLGILDFQDAFLTHPVYDLVSLLTDARVEVSPDIRQRSIARYCQLSGDDPRRLNTAFAAFSVQRNLRILGIFAKAARNGDTRHRSKIPRVYRYLAEALRHPVFEGHRHQLLEGLPDPAEVFP